DRADSRVVIKLPGQAGMLGNSLQHCRGLTLWRKESAPAKVPASAVISSPKYYRSRRPQRSLPPPPARGRIKNIKHRRHVQDVHNESPAGAASPERARLVARPGRWLCTHRPPHGLLDLPGAYRALAAYNPLLRAPPEAVLGVPAGC